MRRLSNWSLFLLASTAWASPGGLSLLENGSHCVAYKAEKTMFLVSSGHEVVGKNCDILAQVLPEVGGLYRIEVIVPIRSFQSGDAGRDEDVGKSLKIDVKPELTFRSKALTPQAWHELFAKNDFDLEGELLVGDKPYPLKVASHYIQTGDGAEVDGIAKVRFQDFEITPPKVVGGLVAKTKPDLELHFHLLGSRILGADSIALKVADGGATGVTSKAEAADAKADAKPETKTETKPATAAPAKAETPSETK